MSDYKFSEVRLQLVEIANSNPSLTDKGYRVLMLLIFHYLNWRDGTWQITDTELAARFSCSNDTISRAVSSIQNSGILDVRRGRWGQASYYSVSKKAMQLAQEMRAERRRNAELQNSGTQQITQSMPTNFRIGVPQKCGATYKKNIKYGDKGSGSFNGKKCGGVEQLTDSDTPRLEGWVFATSGAWFWSRWEDRLRPYGFYKLEDVLPVAHHKGESGYWLPSAIPAKMDSREWEVQHLLLREAIDTQAQDRRKAVLRDNLSKVTHVATPPAPCEGMGKPFPLDPKPGAWQRGGREP